MPGERHPGNSQNVFGVGGVIRDLMGAKTERLILAFSFGGVSLRALHQARVCISRVAIENTTSTFPTFIPPRGASRWRAAPRWRESLARRTERARLHCPTRDPAATPGSRTSPRRLWHSTAPSASRRCSPLRAARHLVRRMAMRWVVVAPRGVPARGGCGGGLVGSQEDCALLASWPGPLWRPEAAMRLLWRDWRQALPASGTAWVVRRVLRASCVYGVVAERRFTFAATTMSSPGLQSAPSVVGAEDLGAGCTLGAICAVAHDH